ncbi:MAG TPA: MraY family glycosyltransferase [Terriglobales bacterium]|jgi:UDP-GlcNAc:undecaprenyl-phosphate/decaprenyl-phosphate GlcNAc-1-phosphate transferase|nr:MraY family glycosyltransferase [Terriglobales bacterium]
MVIPADLIAFGVALLASLGLTIPVRHFALRMGMVDQPGPRKVHVTPIPLLGGIAIYLGFAAAILFTHGAIQQQTIAILSGATLLAIVGFLDDGGLLHHQVKLFLGMPLAALFLLASGIRAQLFSQFIPGNLGLILDGCLTIVWVVGITASFSILDHMDGLCAGITAIAAGFFTLSAYLNGQTIVQTLGAATLGAALGFLRWNFNPAKIFMGDGGAMFLGFLMATLGLKIRPDGAPFPAGWLVPVLILGVPIFDTTMVSISRARRGLLPFTSPGKDHTAHRLSNLGLGHRGAVLALYLLAVIFGTIAVFIPRFSTGASYAIVGALFLCGLIAVLFLESAPFERQAKLQKSTSSL